MDRIFVYPLNIIYNFFNTVSLVVFFFGLPYHFCLLQNALVEKMLRSFLLLLPLCLTALEYPRFSVEGAELCPVFQRHQIKAQELSFLCLNSFSVIFASLSQHTEWANYYVIKTYIVNELGNFSPYLPANYQRSKESRPSINPTYGGTSGDVTKTVF